MHRARLILLFVVFTTAAPLAKGYQNRDPQSVAADILQHRKYQKELPQRAGDEAERAGGDSETINNRKRGTQSGARENERSNNSNATLDPLDVSQSADLGEVGRAIVEIMLWTFAAAGGVYIIYLLIRNFISMFGARKTTQTAPAREWIDSPAAVETTLPDFELRAREGNYSEAVHLLLLHAISALESARARRFPRSQTSREILYSFSASDRFFIFFRDIATQVERTRFGGRDCEYHDYAACLAHYQSLTLALHANTA
ncbi:MAG: hypothetical protein ACKVS6_16805 [Planctomycetota bacterium]